MNLDKYAVDGLPSIERNTDKKRSKQYIRSRIPSASPCYTLQDVQQYVPIVKHVLTMEVGKAIIIKDEDDVRGLKKCIKTYYLGQQVRVGKYRDVHYIGRIK